jgi:hypothetical protein
MIVTDSSAASHRTDPLSAANVMQVAMARRDSAKPVPNRRRAAKATPFIDLTCRAMGISLNLLRSFRSRILALVLGLVTWVLTAAVVGIAVKARTEVERQAGMQLQTAADTAREVLKFRGSQLATAVARMRAAWCSR